MISWLLAIAMLFYLGHPLAVSVLFFAEAVITPISYLADEKVTFRNMVTVQLVSIIAGLLIYLVYR